MVVRRLPLRSRLVAAAGAVLHDPARARAVGRWVWSTRRGTIMTGQMVALKLIMPETATTRSAIDRFHREMSVISQLRHPNIVEWYEQGMTRGQFWFAMEYVVGHQPRDARQGRARPLPVEPGLPHSLPDAQRARAGPSARIRSSRHQAREHPDRPRRPMATWSRSPTSAWPRASAASGSRA